MTTIATRQPEKPTVISELKRVEPFLAESLPKHLNVDRFARLALTTIRKNPRLGQTDPASFIGALYTAAALTALNAGYAEADRLANEIVKGAK